MKAQLRTLLPAILSVCAVNAAATIRYVDLNCTNATPPFTNWTSAATNIQDAIDVAALGDVVLVADGVYSTGQSSFEGSNRIRIWKPVTVQSVDGPGATCIEGTWAAGTTNGPAAVRCAYVANDGVLSGFTLTNGATATGEYGGGVKCQSASAMVSNCVITGNAATFYGGGAYSGTIVNSTLSSNVTVAGGWGAGAYGSALVNCTVIGNRAGYRGGGAYSGSLTNCLLAGNYAGSFGGGTDSSKLVNCTVVGNTAREGGGGMSGGSAFNSIVYFNQATQFVGSVQSNHTSVSSFTNGCTVPAPFFADNIITNPPLFRDLAERNYRLHPASPCINAGNNVFTSASTDLDGNPRLTGSAIDLGAFELTGVVHYVKTANPSAASPYTSWNTAATNIQDAVDAASIGDFIVVSNGTYQTGGRVVAGTITNRVAVDKIVTVQSVNGPQVTRIVGERNASIPPAGIRCVYLATGAIVSGFTLTNGATRLSGDDVLERSGGGVWCADETGVITNCVISGNSAARYGGGAFGGTLLNCLLTNNVASFGGGAASNRLQNCELTSNAALYHNFNSGGGAYQSILDNCLVTANRSFGGAGNGGGTFGGILTRCVLSNNIAGWYGGGAFLGVVSHSLISGNRAFYGGGAGSNTLNNCTVVTNSADPLNGVCGGAFGGTLNNCIVYYNQSPKQPDAAFVTCNYCCLTPLPPSGIGNFTNAPLFVNPAAGEFQLQASSPCINAGNNAYATNSTDLDGNPRIAGSTVDMGAYEFQGTGLSGFAGWLWQHGLRVDGTADTADSDGDTANNWREWVADTNPTNTLSLLKMLSPASAELGVMVSWQSVETRNYFLERATDFGAQPPFQVLQSNIVGQVGTTSYTDTNTLGSGPFLYRVGVQQ